MNVNLDGFLSQVLSVVVGANPTHHQSNRATKDNARSLSNAETRQTETLGNLSMGYEAEAARHAGCLRYPGRRSDLTNVLGHRCDAGRLTDTL